MLPGWFVPWMPNPASCETKPPVAAEIAGPGGNGFQHRPAALGPFPAESRREHPRSDRLPSCRLRTSRPATASRAARRRLGYALLDAVLARRTSIRCGTLIRIPSGHFCGHDMPTIHVKHLARTQTPGRVGSALSCGETSRLHAETRADGCQRIARFDGVSANRPDHPGVAVG